MFQLSDYELLDFGDGRKLERFGSFVVDRPAPAAEGISRSQSEAWSRATARFEIVGDQRGGERGQWIPATALPENWIIDCGSLHLELKPTDFGHLGIFPEQAANWDWIDEQVRLAVTEGNRPKILNLFAYTGGSTLAAAAAGAEVVHVDSARGTVAWARRNAKLSGLSAAPIRWIVEDAARFVHREVARGNRYDAVILDPPSYGHGPAGETWKLDEQLPDLLADCAALTAGRRRFILLTCHTPAVTPDAARRLLAAALDDQTMPNSIVAGELALESAAGRRLPCGVFARWAEAV